MDILTLNDHVAELTEADEQRLLSLLPQWRREAALRYRFAQGRRECAVAYVELLRALRLACGIDCKPRFAYTEHGKPYLPDYPRLHFSISHCREAVGCLLADRPCGLDVECIRPARESLIHYTMNEEEASCILAAPCPDLAFTELWTRKEALFKLRGTGITDDLRTILSPVNLSGILLTTISNPIRSYVLTTAL